jgi:hypothetical protein
MFALASPAQERRFRALRGPLLIAALICVGVLALPAPALGATIVTTNPNQSQTGWDSSQTSHGCFHRA